MDKIFKFAICQMRVGTNKVDNLRHAETYLRQAKTQGADVVMLPECFNSPYGIQHFPNYAET
jgi:omega-amidase